MFVGGGEKFLCRRFELVETMVSCRGLFAVVVVVFIATGSKDRTLSSPDPTTVQRAATGRTSSPLHATGAKFSRDCTVFSDARASLRFRFLTRADSVDADPDDERSITIPGSRWITREDDNDDRGMFPTPHMSHLEMDLGFAYVHRPQDHIRSEDDDVAATSLEESRCAMRRPMVP